MPETIRNKKERKVKLSFMAIISIFDVQYNDLNLIKLNLNLMRLNYLQCQVNQVESINPTKCKLRPHHPL